MSLLKKISAEYQSTGKQTANIYHVRNIHAKHLGRQPLEVEARQFGTRPNLDIGRPAGAIAHQSGLDLIVKNQGLALQSDENFIQNDFFMVR